MDLLTNILPALPPITYALIGAWLASFLRLRKDERSIQIEHVTRERTRWRDQIRALTNETVKILSDAKSENFTRDTLSCRSRLVIALNPNDPFDTELIEYLDKLIEKKESNINGFTLRISLLLKHDWERVKNECTPIYKKPFNWVFNKNSEWQKKNFRALPIDHIKTTQPPNISESRGFLDNLLDIKRSDVTLKFLFDNLRNYTIAAAMIAAGLYLINHGSSIKLIPGIGNATGATLIAIGIVGYVLNFAQSILASLKFSISGFIYSIISATIFFTSIDFFITAINRTA